MSPTPGRGVHILGGMRLYGGKRRDLNTLSFHQEKGDSRCQIGQLQDPLDLPFPLTSVRSSNKGNFLLNLNPNQSDLGMERVNFFKAEVPHFLPSRPWEPPLTSLSPFPHLQNGDGDAHRKKVWESLASVPHSRVLLSTAAAVTDLHVHSLGQFSLALSHLSPFCRLRSTASG